MDSSGDVPRTSSPNLMLLPPQPGKRTLSPAWTVVATILPSLFGAPGPTAMTVASGSGEEVAEVGRNMPVAVFYSLLVRKEGFDMDSMLDTYRFCFETLDEHAVQEWD